MKGCQTLATLTFFIVANLVCITASAVPPGGSALLSAGAAPQPISGGLFQAIWRPGAQDAGTVRYSNYVNADGRPVVIPAGYGPPMVAGQGARQNVGGVMPAGYAYGSTGPAGYGYASCGPGCGSASCGCGGSPGVFPCEGYCGASPACNPYAAGPGVYGPCPPPGTCPPYGCGGQDELCGAGCLGLDQWGPHYFDVRIEAVAMTRTSTFEPYQEFAQKGIMPDSAPVLDSDQLEYNFEPGFRIVGRYDLGPLAVFEFGYMGIYGFDSNAKARDEVAPGQEGDLYSLWSGIFCKNSPQFVPAEIPGAGGPHAATERSTLQSIRIQSDLQTAEMSYRRYWVGYTPKISGTFLAGIRYTRITEDFLYHTEGGQFENLSDVTDTGEMDYDLETENNLLGFQTGGDMWITIRQGLRIGGETKVGIYGNHHKVHTNIDVYGDTSELISDFSKAGDSAELDEEFSGNRVAFIGEASLDVVFDLSPSWSLRAGYEVLFANSLALAGQNFNNGNIYEVIPVDGCPPTRSPFSNSNGTALYHGAHVGAEYIW